MFSMTDSFCKKNFLYYSFVVLYFSCIYRLPISRPVQTLGLSLLYIYCLFVCASIVVSLSVEFPVHLLLTKVSLKVSLTWISATHTVPIYKSYKKNNKKEFFASDKKNIGFIKCYTFFQ